MINETIKIRYQLEPGRVLQVEMNEWIVLFCKIVEQIKPRIEIANHWEFLVDFPQFLFVAYAKKYQVSAIHSDCAW